MNIVLAAVAGTAVTGLISSAASGIASTASGVITGVYAIGQGVRWLTSSSPPPTMKETLDGLSAVREEVCQREEQLQRKMSEHRSRAQEFADKGQLREARLQITLRLLYDSQIKNIQKTMTAIESHLCALQNAELNRSVLVALHHSSRALGRRGYDEDAVDTMLERLDEQHEQTRDILDSINSAQNLDAASLDEAEIDAELQSMLPRQHSTTPQNGGSPPISKAAPAIVFPAVPTTPLPRLQAEASQ